MENWFPFELESVTLPESIRTLLISTAVFLLFIAVLQSLSSRFIRRKVTSPDLRRRWLVQSRNALVLLLLLGLILIWGSELRTLALSVVAIAVALVVATKELILCVTGSVLKTGARSFKLGDRIQIKEFRGDVIDQNFFATTVMEIGPGKLTHQRTGRVIIVPNSIFFTEPVVNENYTHDFVLHVFTVPFKRADDWRQAQKDLLETAQRHCHPYLEEFRQHMNRIAQQQGLDTPSVDPRVTIQVPEADEIHLIVRIPVKSTQRGYIEQSILTDVFSRGDYTRTEEPVDSD